MRAPAFSSTFLAALWQPQKVFAQVERTQQGIALLLWLTAFEFVVSRPQIVVRSLQSLHFRPFGALLDVWSSYVRFALVPVVAVLAVSFVLVALGRTQSRIVNLAAAFSHAYLPHTVAVSLAVMADALGFAVPRYWNVVAMLPTLVLGAIAVRTIGQRRPQPETLPPIEPSPRGLRFGVVLVAVAALTSAGFLGARDWSALRPMQPGDVLPNLVLESLTGNRVQTSSLKGRVVLVDFWATWCPPCVASMPALENLHRDLGAKGFELVSINVEPDNIAGVQEFVKTHGLSFPVYSDKGAAQSQMRVVSFPSAFLVDKQGVIREVFVGLSSEGSLRSSIEGLL